MKVNGLVDNPKWKLLVCTCQGKLDLCLHCKYTKALESVPKENFKVNDDVLDKNGKVTKKQTRIVKEITIVKGSHDDVIGFLY